MTNNDERLLEEISNLCHIEWMDWSMNITEDLDEAINVLDDNLQYLQSFEDNEEKRELVRQTRQLKDKLTEKVEKWKSLWISYEQLDEEDKEKDRIYAGKILKLMENNNIP